MTWSSESSTQLTLTGSHQTVQRSAADWAVTLNPCEEALITFDFNPQASATENCDIRILRSGDNTLFETDGEGLRVVLSFDNDESDDPVVATVKISGVRAFKIRARVRDTDDQGGGTDTSSTLDVDVAKNGVSL